MSTNQHQDTVPAQEVFADPVAFLSRFGIDACLVEHTVERAIPAAA